MVRKKTNVLLHNNIFGIRHEQGGLVDMVGKRKVKYFGDFSRGA